MMILTKKQWFVMNADLFVVIIFYCAWLPIIISVNEKIRRTKGSRSHIYTEKIY